MAQVWMDYDRSEVEEVVGPLPDGLTYARYDGEHEPDGIDEVEFYVPPYFGPADPALVTRMPALEVVQAPSAGVDHLLPHVPADVALCRAAGSTTPVRRSSPSGCSWRPSATSRAGSRSSSAASGTSSTAAPRSPTGGC
ncbi:hypothetical protein [Nocardioides zeae]